MSDFKLRMAIDSWKASRRCLQSSPLKISNKEEDTCNYKYLVKFFAHGSGIYSVVILDSSKNKEYVVCESTDSQKCVDYYLSVQANGSTIICNLKFKEEDQYA